MPTTLTHSDLVNLWGRQWVVRFTESSVRGAAIPGETKRLLINVGLPWRIWHWFTVEQTDDCDGRGAPPRDGRVRLARLSDERVRLGEDYGCNDFCIQPSGEVLFIPRDGRYELGLVNSSVAQFIEFLFRVGEFRRSVDGLSEAEAHAAMVREALDEIVTDEEADRRARQLEAELREIDPSAFRSPGGGWWPHVFDSS